MKKLLYDIFWSMDVLFVGQKPFFKINHDNISHFRLKKNGSYLDCKYHFNSYGDICINVDDLEFALSNSYGYDIEF